MVFKLRHCLVKVASACDFPSQSIQGLLEADYKNKKINGEQH